MSRQPPWVLIASLIIGGGLQPFIAALGTLVPAYATVIGQIAGIVVAIAGLVYTYYQAVNAPASAVVKDAPIVTSDGVPTGATNISSSSSLLTPQGAKPQ